ncbi:MAG TPA: VOC family protein [Candidatus Solibacter sp.]|nr:VOC family protein [Candidatus Solibacter sp.]
MSASAKDVEVQAPVAPKAVVALLKVADVDRSIGFYEKLRFEAGNEPLTDDQGVKTFAWMHHGSSAQIMLTRAGQPLDSNSRQVMFYLYVTDMPAYREQLVARGINVGKVSYPFWSPNGEFQVDDPDGWVWIVC